MKLTSPFVPRIASIATAVPPQKVSQSTATDFFDEVFGSSFSDPERLKGIFRNAEIETRYACAAVEWYKRQHGLAEKNRLYIENAVALLKQVAADALEAASLEPGQIDMIVTVSSTGIAVPTLDARLMEELPFRRDVGRLPLFGYGCAGGVLGLARAAACARAKPRSRVLFLVVELCTLTLRPDDRSMQNVVALAICGDGAAAVVLTEDGEGPAISTWGEYTWPASVHVTGWNVTDDGFGVVLSRRIPRIVRNEMQRATIRFLGSQDLGLDDMDELVCHPGGAGVLDALEQVFDLPKGGLEHSRAILREYGNMSASTVIFVLDRTLATTGLGVPRRRLMTSLGPGFSAAYMVLE